MGRSEAPRGAHGGATCLGLQQAHPSRRELEPRREQNRQGMIPAEFFCSRQWGVDGYLGGDWEAHELTFGEAI